MSVDREFFLEVLASDEDNEQMRMAYADWLEEQGEDEEADRQRRWTAAKAWIVDIIGDGDRWNDDDDDDHHPMSYQQLIDLGHAAVRDGREDGWLSIHCGGHESLCDRLRSSGNEFWENWSVVTGVQVPPGLDDQVSYSCAC